jgi:enediyne biosynthesis protein E4
MVQTASTGVSPKNRRRLHVWVALGLVVLLLAVPAAALVVLQRSFQSELTQARAALTAKRFGVAHQRLSRLAERWSNNGEVDFLLGNSEAALGKRDDALASWARVPASSPFVVKAAVARASCLVEKGHYSSAESLLLEAMANPGRSGRYELELALTWVYWFQLRFYDICPLIRASWCRAAQPALALKELWGVEMGPRPVELLKDYLSKSDKNDDRVWLGWANYAILTGQFAEARLWLSRCLRRRPDDMAVWQAQFELSLATGDVDGFWRAAPYLPAARFSRAEVQAFRVWLAASNHDRGREESALESLIECDPGNANALERLAVLNVESGRHREAESLHRRRDEVTQTRDAAVQILNNGIDVPNRAGVLAELSAKMGRSFDAQAWTILAEAGLSDHSLVPPLSAEGSSPLPASFVARATALSATYGLVGEDVARAGPMLSERLADLRPRTVGRQAKTTHPRFGRAAAESKKCVPDFVDDAQAAGLHFQLESGQSEQHLLPETMSGGVGLIDFDGDGWLDVYCVQGGALTDSPGGPASARTPAGDRLFRNRGDGTFEDVTEKTGVARIAWGQGYGHGVAVGDYDNDGLPDLFVTRLMSYSLYRNQGNGTFDDVTTSAGLAGRRDHPTSAAWADLDNDGDLDLYVCHYMIWDPAHPTLCPDKTGRNHYCYPLKVSPSADHVFRNDGHRFIDVTAQSGCAEKEGRGMGVVAADLDGDQRIDLFVANDSTVNYLWRNRGGFHFEETGVQAGVGASVQGGYQAGMGIACGDLDGDGLLDLMVTNFYGEGTTLYQNLGNGLFTDRSAASGIALATRFLLGFGIAMADVTNYGRLDVMITNGHVDDDQPFYRMPSRLFENRPDGRLVDISERAGECWQVKRVGRGLAAGDLDNDGRVDALILAQNEPLAYFHNRSQSVGNFVTFRLEGTKSNRDGVGASVTVVAGGRRQVVQRCGGGSYQSANDPRLHFGLGGSGRVDSVEVRWPSGHVDHWTDLPANTGYLLRERQPEALHLNGFKPRLSCIEGRPHMIQEVFRTSTLDRLFMIERDRFSDRVVHVGERPPFQLTVETRRRCPCSA